MPERIRFDVYVPLAERAAIAVVLVPLADAGFGVQVEFPGDGLALGWRIRLNARGWHASFRIRRGATHDEWATAVETALLT